MGRGGGMALEDEDGWGVLRLPRSGLSWESWVLHLNQHMLWPSGGSVNGASRRQMAAGHNYESERRGPQRERRRGRRVSEVERMRRSADPINKRDREHMGWADIRKGGRKQGWRYEEGFWGS
ncbi:hypothetical protein DPEC_G00175320 [Dallia pectoralis]|uniref:Uncharacterized protein n=1 Tax=Dallia pectoralis TaxID=75939 RepID=A0ACC2GER8_DALPE|nr:hypothetical protein DPEC_G00175320 [Dallia pectoralis]